MAALLVASMPVSPQAPAAPPVIVGVAPVFGAGPLAFHEFEVPGDSAAEPTIGIPWDTDSVFYYPSSTGGALTDPDALAMHTMRARFDATGTPTWAQVDPQYQVPINLDPMLVADPDTGRIFAGGLLGPCSSMVYSDDDGETWLPTINMCSGEDFDHQSIGLGPPAGPLPSPEGTHIGYYCGQGGTVSCARSLDQGTTWGPFQQVPGSCGGFHGHIRVSTLTGFAAVPTASCGSHSGYISTADGGLTWRSHEVEASAEWSNGFDPSVQFSRPSGWMYYGMASEHGVYMALSKDEGATWEPLGAGMGVEPTSWLDVGQFHDPPVVSGVFTNVQTGDDDRVALSFLGLEAGPGADLKFLRSNEIYQCDDRQDQLVWNAYVALSYDAGSTWTVQKASADPVQVGGIFDSVVDSQSGACRNLLDFNDMDIDSTGRMHVGLADGCTRKCAETGTAPAQGQTLDGYRDAAPRLLRQVGGKGLFKEFDTVDPRPDLDGDGTVDAEDTDLDGDGIPNSQDRDVDGDGVDDGEDPDVDGDGIVDAQDPSVAIPEYTKPAAAQESPGLPLAALLVAMLSLAVWRRR
ncbi:MAG: hypothetical protein QOJ26_783 [Thermoplasmata archaeon]|nr:hypothetical protein [Thermoplasmata archaeon]